MQLDEFKTIELRWAQWAHNQLGEFQTVGLWWAQWAHGHKTSWTHCDHGVIVSTVGTKLVM